jgi:hypothetical protein
MYDPEDKLFKMWMRTGSDSKSGYLDGHAAFTTYLTSKDGVHWDKPELGALSIAGRRDHNIVFTGFETDITNPQGKKGYILPRNYQFQGKKGWLWSVIKHPNPRDAGEKYLGLAFLMKRRGAYLATSPDGIHWSCDEDAPFWQTPNDVSGKGDDALMHLIHDREKQKWVVYRRVIPEFSERLVANESDGERKAVDRYYRSYAYAESDDLREWKHHQFILSMDADDPADTELYQFACHKFGAIYVGYLSVFHLRSPQSIDIQLATSRDGINFTRVCRGEPFIASGPRGYYDLMAMGCSQPEPIVVDDTHYLYYAAVNIPHDGSDPNEQGGVALATFKRDRFASLEAGEIRAGPSRVVTKPFAVEHTRLFLNAATWEKGSIRVEVLTPDWQPIPGFTAPQAVEIQGDALDFPVRWKDNADLGKLLGTKVRLKFYLTRARIHAMTLGDDDRKLSPVGIEDRYDKLGDATPKGA